VFGSTWHQNQYAKKNRHKHLSETIINDGEVALPRCRNCGLFLSVVGQRHKERIVNEKRWTAMGDPLEA
jgi:hypothetical protein